jgi:hypothetical protein
VLLVEQAGGRVDQLPSMSDLERIHVVETGERMQQGTYTI